jgi:uncharacterized protein
MNIVLTPMEARIIGCLIEKQITTPDQYPLSLNALVNACNQKSNRDPMMDVDEPVVQRTLDDLSKKHLIMERSGFGSRVPKYQHRFCNTEFGTLKFTPQELAIVCELLLRGPQTPGELRPRAARMAPFTDADQVEATLEVLRTRADGPFVVRLPRESGRRDSAYAHLFGGPVAAAARSATVSLEAARGDGSHGAGSATAGSGGAASGTVGVGASASGAAGPGAAPSGAAASDVAASGAAPSGGATSGVARSAAAGSFVAELAAAAPRFAGPTSDGLSGSASGHRGEGGHSDDSESRIARLEAEVRQLRSELDFLKKQLGV